MRPSKPWFDPKLYGYGSGLLIAWQGWLVLLIYILFVISARLGLVILFPKPTVQIPTLIGVELVATLALGVSCALKTSGGGAGAG